MSLKIFINLVIILILSIFVVYFMKKLISPRIKSKLFFLLFYVGGTIIFWGVNIVYVFVPLINHYEIEIRRKEMVYKNNVLLCTIMKKLVNNGEKGEFFYSSQIDAVIFSEVKSRISYFPFVFVVKDKIIFSNEVNYQYLGPSVSETLKDIKNILRIKDEEFFVYSLSDFGIFKEKNNNLYLCIINTNLEIQRYYYSTNDKKLVPLQPVKCPLL